MSCFILPSQNGVPGGAMHYGAGGDTSSPPKEPSNGHVVSKDTLARPKSLVVKTSNGFPSKNSEENENDSLPSSPELQSDSETDESASGGSSAGNEVLENDTRQLMGRFFREFTLLSKPQWTESRELTTMKRVVDDVLSKHRYSYNGMINKLSLEDREDDACFLSKVAESLFADGKTNWGRIASLVAFGAVVCQDLKEKHRENCVEMVAQEISTYLLSDQRDWLVKNNGWDGFVEFFRVADPESTVRNTLMAFAGVAGIGATLALLIR
ncbi:induced myeloid leukemia cell differentiation protein Mcl-1b [Eleginops maclovinus]|uniref:induced myeloid leukemia cell differentiation protein Mcl-1b n=1 Tax=Eleginops maclovinus TaxID=56733 RepID=UPI003080F35D